MTPIPLYGRILGASAEGGGEVMPVWVAFLLLLGFVVLFGLVLTWHYRPIERQQEESQREESPEQRRAKLVAEAKVMPGLIERLDALNDQATALEIDLEVDPPLPSTDSGLATAPTPEVSTSLSG